MQNSFPFEEKLGYEIETEYITLVKRCCIFQEEKLMIFTTIWLVPGYSR